MRERTGKQPRSAAPARSRGAPQPMGELARVASAVGNAQFARLVAPGGGMLADGTVHPSVQRLIADRAGHGSRLDSGMERWADRRLAPGMPAVGIHTDATANALAQSVSARAFTVRNDIFFSGGAYQPHTSRGRELVAHELAHVAQQQGAATSGPLKVSQPGDALERDAERIATDSDG